MPKKLLTMSVILAAVLSTGCSAYRTNSDISFDSTELGNRQPVIPVGQIDADEKEIKRMGFVHAIIKKVSALHKDPTRQQADIVLGHKAQKMGADAVIDVSYSSSIGIDTWGQMKASGTAVKVEE